MFDFFGFQFYLCQENNQTLLDFTAQEWLSLRFPNVQIAPPVATPKCVIFNGEYPLISPMRLRSLLQFSLKHGCNLSFDGGRIYLREGCKQISTRIYCGARMGAPMFESARKLILRHHMRRGVHMQGQEITIGGKVQIEEGVTLSAPLKILGNSQICRDAQVEHSTLVNTYVGQGAHVSHIIATDSHIDKNTTVGPFTHLRKGAKIGENCRIGNFVELKNTTVGNGTKVAHHVYLGDASVGKDCNIGCGVIVANYDGKIKHQTVIEDDCFVGCNSNLIAPVHLKRGCYVAAGTTVTETVEAGALCIGRQRQKQLPHRGEGKYRG